MATQSVKIVVIYPRPQDLEAFEKVYRDEHIPMLDQKLAGKTRLVLTKVASSPQGKVAAYRMAEVHFSSMDDLNKCLESDGGKEVLAHAAQISTGGQPVILVCEEESFVFW